MSMTRGKLDREKVEAALKRAARVAITGPKEAQSGRLLVSPPAESAPKQLRQLSRVVRDAKKA